MPSKVCNLPSCDVLVTRKPSDMQGNVYCSRSHAVTHNNHLNPKRKRNRSETCSCGAKKHGDSKQCKNCYLGADSSLSRFEQLREKAKRTTIQDVKNLYDKNEPLFCKRWLDAIRQKARKLNNASSRDKSCLVCGYSKYVELCHIVPISAMPSESTLLEVNGEDNTIYLCPNHHKELDNNMMSPEDLYLIENRSTSQNKLDGD